MSKIAEALASNPRICTFAKMFASLDAEDQDAIGEAIASGITSNMIAVAIKKGGYKMSHQTITDHREEVCRCIGATK